MTRRRLAHLLAMPLLLVEATPDMSIEHVSNVAGLRAAITRPGPISIKLAPGTYSLGGSPLEPNGTIILDGENGIAILDGEHLSRIFG